jgi:hypothetical protein
VAGCLADLDFTRLGRLHWCSTHALGDGRLGFSVCG